MINQMNNHSPLVAMNKLGWQIYWQALYLTICKNFYHNKISRYILWWWSCIFEGKCNNKELTKWLDDFQEQVNIICKRDKIVFKLDIWNPSNNKKPSESVSRVVSSSICDERKIPTILDTSMFWNKENKLQFKVQRKKDKNSSIWIREFSSKQVFLHNPIRALLEIIQTHFANKGESREENQHIVSRSRIGSLQRKSG